MDGDIAWAIAPQRSLPGIVAERVVEAMRGGGLKPGERIVEATLAAKLGVSRGPLREALRALEADGLVETKRGRGTRVTEVSASQALQMVIMRATLEGLAARLVAARRDPATLRALEAQHARIRTAAETGHAAEWREQDWRFHEMVCAAADNGFLLRAWQSIGNLVRLYLHRHPAYDEANPGVLANHEAFIAALRGGDPDSAETTFRTAILRSGLARLGVDAAPGFAP